MAKAYEDPKPLVGDGHTELMDFQLVATIYRELRENSGPKDDFLGYRVGYCRPPKKHRFKPGQSGNPKGRPRGSRNKPKLNPKGWAFLRLPTMAEIRKMAARKARAVRREQPPAPLSQEIAELLQQQLDRPETPRTSE